MAVTRTTHGSDELNNERFDVCSAACEIIRIMRNYPILRQDATHCIEIGHAGHFSVDPGLNAFEGLPHQIIVLKLVQHVTSDSRACRFPSAHVP